MARSDLHALLLTMAAKVYFQPPPNVQMEYPCCLYSRSRIRGTHANNGVYGIKKQYTVTVIDQDPDSLIPDQVAQIPTAKHDRYYSADGLHHDVFTIFY